MGNPLSEFLGDRGFRKKYNEIWKEYHTFLKELEAEEQTRESNPAAKLAYEHYQVLLKIAQST